jgi:hypothetical protein
MKQMDEFKVELWRDNVATIFSCRQQKFVGAEKEDGNRAVVACLVDEPYEWTMTSKTDGTYTFECPNGFLSVTDDDDDSVCESAAASGILCVIADPATVCCWRLNPCLPRAISSSKIRTFAIGTTAAIATTIAMPFAVAGVVGLIGTEMGILANVVAATLTGAEALASVGVVGATAAMVFRETATGDSQTAAASVDDEEKDEPNKYKMRPFCDWRAW